MAAIISSCNIDWKSPEKRICDIAKFFVNPGYMSNGETLSPLLEQLYLNFMEEHGINESETYPNTMEIRNGDVHIEGDLSVNGDVYISGRLFVNGREVM